jgi:hypothetical protein
MVMVMEVRALRRAGSLTGSLGRARTFSMWYSSNLAMSVDAVEVFGADEPPALRGGKLLVHLSGSVGAG